MVAYNQSQMFVFKLPNHHTMQSFEMHITVIYITHCQQHNLSFVQSLTVVAVLVLLSSSCLRVLEFKFLYIKKALLKATNIFFTQGTLKGVI